MKTLKLIFGFVLVAIVLSSCTVAVMTSNAVQVPNEVKVALNAVILIGVMYGLQLLLDYVHIDLRGIGVTIAAAISEAAILQLQGWIDLVPVAYDPFVTVGLQILLAVLVFLGGVRLLAHPERARQLLTKK